jgi:hypothetical protein
MDGTWEGLNAALRERLRLRLGRHVQHLTKVLLEEQLSYEEVVVHTSDLESVYEDVA